MTLVLQIIGICIVVFVFAGKSGQLPFLFRISPPNFLFIFVLQMDVRQLTLRRI